MFLERPVNGYSMLPYSDTIMEPDKLSALMADMVCLTNRTSESLGIGGLANKSHLPVNDPPNQHLAAANGVKRKHHVLTE